MHEMAFSDIFLMRFKGLISLSVQIMYIVIFAALRNVSYWNSVLLIVWSYGIPCVQLHGI